MHPDWKACTSINELKAKLTANCCSGVEGGARTARKRDISDVIDRAIDISIESIAKDAERYRKITNGNLDLGLLVWKREGIPDMICPNPGWVEIDNKAQADVVLDCMIGEE